MKQPIVYIMTNQRNGTLYTGVTSNLIKRVYEHKADIHNGFSKKYGCKHLVFYELYETMEAAIHRCQWQNKIPRERASKFPTLH